MKKLINTIDADNAKEGLKLMSIGFTLLVQNNRLIQN